MKAIVAEGPGGPEVMQLRDRPSPQPDGTHTLVRIDASGVNRHDLDVRRGSAPGVRFPRIPGSECAGTVSEDPSGRLRPGQKVVAFLGGLGRSYDGSYARFAAIRSDRVFALKSDLDWVSLAALPIAYATAGGAIFDRLALERGHSLLVRGASASIGLAAMALAAEAGARVVATTRSADKIETLRSAGAEEVIVDEGRVADRVLAIMPPGVDRVLDLVGPSALKDSLAACADGGMLCAVGTLGGLGGRTDRWALGPALDRVRLVDYDVEGEPYKTTGVRLQSAADALGEGRLPSRVEAVYPLDDAAAAHQRMEENRTCGKLVLEIAKR